MLFHRKMKFISSRPENQKFEKVKKGQKNKILRNSVIGMLIKNAD